MRGRPGRRERRRQHRRTPARRHRSTVAGWISTSASRHRGQNHRNNSQNRRSAGRKRLLERAEDAELVAQGKSLEQEVSTRRPIRLDGSTRPDDGSHRL